MDSGKNRESSKEMFCWVVKKRFLQEREKSQAVKNRTGSQVFCFVLRRQIDQFQNKPANKEN